MVEKEKKEKESIVKRPAFNTVEYLTHLIIIIIYIGVWIILAPIFGAYVSMNYFLVLLIISLLGNFILQISKPFPKELEIPKIKINHFILLVYSILDLVSKRSPNQIPQEEFVEKLLLMLKWKLRDLKKNDMIEQEEIDKLIEIFKKKGWITGD